MKIEKVKPDKEREWNEFIIKNGPPVGSFIQAWEWGQFYEKLGRKVERYFVVEETPIAAFTLVYQKLPFGFVYGYAPRGPIISSPDESKYETICNEIRNWALKEIPELIFLRLEPPLPIEYKKLPKPFFETPSYYIQPKFNSVILLDKEEKDLLESFHPSTKSNINRAERRGVTVKIKNEITEEEFEQFKKMMGDTSKRNHGKKIYPSVGYFNSLFALLFKNSSSNNLNLVAFYGYCDGKPAATHFVLFFGKTATYLYGASHSEFLNSKVTTLLHFEAMKEAKRAHMSYYDIGAVDEKRWRTLTQFKRQFNGREFQYIGNVDIPIRPFGYKIFNILRNIKK